MKVVCGGKELRTHEELTYIQLLDRYIEEAPKKYEGDFVEKNVELAKQIKSGKINYRKLVAVGTGCAIVVGALLGLIDPTSAFASTHHAVTTTAGLIDADPLKKFFHEIYYSLLRIILYLTIPVWAWVGVTLAFSGANVERRTMAKKIGSALIIGVGFVVGAPWIANQIYNLWVHVFSI